MGPGRTPAPPDAGRRRGKRLARAGRAVVVAASVLVLAVTGYGWSQYRTLTDGVRKSGDLAALAVPPVIGTTTNILVMGLDSRLDENGNPLPQAIYDALNSGDANVGGYNANVLMLLHIPGDGSRATAISIPRDDYVDLAGSPDGTAKGKIKQAYGLAFDQQHRRLVAQGITDKTTLEQQSRDAGRNAEISTVSQFLGGVPIDHFVEVTMVAFYQIAQVVSPITVCLDENTRDSYSGADFHQGRQQIDAAQAVAFVRQRRDNTHPELNFTDLDRERRQQAFIASLAYQLKQAGTLSDPSKLTALIDVAKQNTAVDPGLNLLSLAQQAASLTSGNITFTTLPIDHFGTDPLGEDVNIIDPAHVQAVVAGLLAPPPPAAGATATPAPVPPSSVTVDVVNAGGRTGLAASVSRTVSSDGYSAGTTGNGPHTSGSTIDYPPGDAAAAQALARNLGITTTSPDPAEAPHHLKVVLGTTFTPPTTTAAAPTTPPAASAAASTLADSITGGSIPCVK